MIIISFYLSPESFCNCMNFIIIFKLTNHLFRKLNMSLRSCVNALTRRLHLSLARYFDLLHGMLWLVTNGTGYGIFFSFLICRLKMGISFASRNPLYMIVKKNIAILMFLHFWTICIIDRSRHYIFHILQSFATSSMSYSLFWKRAILRTPYVERRNLSQIGWVCDAISCWFIG